MYSTADAKRRAVLVLCRYIIVRMLPRAYSAWATGGKAALCLRYVQHAGGWYAQPVRAVRRPRDMHIRVNTAEGVITR